MKILIATDMEGASGVVHFDQTDPSHAEYARFRRLLTGDVNAAIQGAAAAGATEFIVADGHWNGSNILIEELDPRAQLFSGSPTPWGMVDGVDQGVDAALFIGYHARAGTQNAILDHTWSSVRVFNVWLNGRLVGEFGLNAAVCGHFGVPVLMVSGDQAVCAEAAEWVNGIETAVVKNAAGQMSAQCLPLETARRVIRETAERAVRRMVAGDAPPALQVAAPVTIEIEFHYPQMTDHAALLPGSQRLDGRRLAYRAADMLEAYRAFRAAVGLAAK
ncbi:MAG: M55 family metallopeptidase [Chloroflexota bacterium]